MAGADSGTQVSPSPWRVVASNVMAKTLLMVVSGLISFVTTRMIIQHFGLVTYAQYGLLASMGALVPFADLGMSAAVINAIAGSEDPSQDRHVRRVLLSAFRVLIGSACVLALIGLSLTMLGLWPAILGDGLQAGGSGVALACVLVFALTLPMGVGQRILTGLGKNHVQIRAQFLAAPIMFVAVATLVFAGAKSGNYLAVFSYLSGTAVAATSLVLASRNIRPQVRSALVDVPKIRSVRGARTMHVAWPMLAQMVALPIAMQTDRLLLSHLGNTSDLAEYNLAAQLFGMIVQIVSAAGIALWPLFARARSAEEVRSPVSLTYGFLLGGLLAACVLALVSPWVVPILSYGKIQLSPWLLLGFIVFVTAQATKYPLGMYMTDAAGLRFQVLPIFVLVPLNLMISWALIAPVGAAGPIIGSAISVILCQVLPNAWYVRRDLVRRRMSAADGERMR